MSFFSNNLRLLRSQQDLSQKVLAERLLISRANLSKYELSAHQPSFEVLIRISRYFNISVDVLLTVDLSQLDRDENEKVKGNKNMIFPVQVDDTGQNVIEVVPHNAQAGYAGMYSDVGFIESLDHMVLPFLSHYGKCRAFPISGDSMPPFGDGSFVIGEYVESRDEVKDGKRYILLSRDEGILFKRVLKKIGEQGSIQLCSDNPKYSSFDMYWKDVIEIWEFVAAISVNESSENYLIEDMMRTIENLQDDLKRFSDRFSMRKN